MKWSSARSNPYPVQCAKFKHLRFLTMVFFTNVLTAQIETFPLWATSIPNAIHDSKYEEIQSFDGMVLNSVSRVTLPMLTVYRPENRNWTSIIIFPGCRYQNLSINKEGYKVAEWLNTLGITAIVLKYRLPSDRIMKDKSVGHCRIHKKLLDL